MRAKQVNFAVLSLSTYFTVVEEEERKSCGKAGEALPDFRCQAKPHTATSMLRKDVHFASQKLNMFVLNYR